MTKNITITIDKSIYNYIPEFNIIAYMFSTSNKELKDIKKLLFSIDGKTFNLTTSNECINLKNIKFMRDTYKKIGVDPSHTRCSVEALTRRAINNKLYSVSPIVDLGNVLSLMVQRSVCVLDFDKVQGNLFITLGKSGERIDAIGRLSINGEGLVVYKDDLGIVGSTTSDSNRTKVELDTKNILVIVVNFTKPINEEETLVKLFNEFLNISKQNKIYTE